MRILVTNVGSTSLKYNLYDFPREQSLASGRVERIGSGKGTAAWNHGGHPGSVEQAFASHREAIEFILEVGVEKIAPVVAMLGDRMAEGARARGYELLGERTPATAAGIVSIRKPGLESVMVVRQLKERGMLAAPRTGWVRISPHFYIAPEEIDQVVAALP
mgnify:CR=1 FL=1